jgi:presenilin-like A22 family membrane protease
VTSISLITPLIISILIAILCSVIILRSGVEFTSATIFPETGLNPMLNAVFYLIIISCSATLIYFLLRITVHRFLRVLMAIAFFSATFSLLMVYLQLLLKILAIELSIPTVFFLSFALSLFLLRPLINASKALNVFTLAFGGSAGALLGASIPLLSSIYILILLAFYDIISVFYGPIGKIVSLGLEHLPGVTFTYRNIQIGLGDLTFYSMLVSRLLLSFGWLACSAGALGVLLGSYISFKMLEKKKIFPGLPFSILFGLSAGILASTI